MAKMKSHTEYLTVKTDRRYEMVHMTPLVEDVVKRSGVDDGLCYVSPMHTTAAIYLNDDKEGLNEDIGAWLEAKLPTWPEYQQMHIGEHADAHLKAIMMHHETTLPVTEGKLDLGMWQKIFYAEFDGQREKQIIVKVLGVAK